MIPALSEKTERHQSSAPIRSRISRVDRLMQVLKRESISRDASLAVVIGDPGVEDLVLAVFGPGLGEAFQLRVGHPGPQADLLAPGEDGVVFQVVPEDPHLLEAQGEDPLLADPDELLVGAVEVDLLRPGTVFSR